MKKLSLTLSHYLPAILSGILIGTSYIPFPPWALFFCFVPLWIQWSKAKTFKEVFISGWITQFVLTLIGFNWVAHTIREFGHIPFPINTLLLLVYCSFANLYIPLAGLAWFAIKKSLKKYLPSFEFKSIFLIPVAISVSEMTYPMIFDWHYGYPWIWLGWPAFHIAEWIGFRGLSLISIFMNLFAVFIWLNFKSNRQKSFRLLGAAISILVVLNVSGWILKNRASGGDAVARVLIVQANIGNMEKQLAEKGQGFQGAIVDKYVQLTESALNQPEALAGPVAFVLWPETAFPDHLAYYSNSKPSKYQVQLRAMIKRTRVPLVTGAYGWHESVQDYSNSIFSFNREGDLLPESYDKTHLLAFGEYFPGAKLFPILKVWVPSIGEFVRGTGPKIMPLENLLLGPQVCYEGLFDDVSRGSANLGAQMIVNVTNDSWYGTWQEPYQHLYMTLARAIEIRRPLVRSTNTGISTVVTAKGEILEKSPLNTEWTQLYQVPFDRSPTKTVFQGWGFYFSWAFLALWSLGLMGICIREKT